MVNHHLGAVTMTMGNKRKVGRIYFGSLFKRVFLFLWWWQDRNFMAEVVHEGKPMGPSEQRYRQYRAMATIYILKYCSNDLFHPRPIS